MARSWSYVGFTPAANKLLQEKIQIGTRHYTDEMLDGTKSAGSEPIMAPTYTSEVYHRHSPWYDEELELLKLTFTDGRVLETYVQAEPWAGGPNTYMAIRDHETKIPLPETLWSQNQIDGFEDASDG